MKEEAEHYYLVELEVSLKTEETIFGYTNISNIPYSKLYEIFKDVITDERFLFDGAISYMIDKKIYLQHKEYLDKAISFIFNFDLFEYRVGLSSIKASEYKKDYHEELPPRF